MNTPKPSSSDNSKRNHLITLLMGITMLWLSQPQSAHAANERITLQGKDLFVSGMNLAWINFAEDVGDAPLDSNRMRRAIEDIRDAGGNSMRWWLFTNGARTPTFNAQGFVNGISPYTVSNIKKALDIAHENGMVISLCLLSFDLMQAGQVGSWNNMSIANNRKMLTTDAGVDSLVAKAIIPLVKGVGNHPAIMTWEVFNEPEGMTQEFGWTNEKVTMADVQKVVNRVAAAIKDNAPGIPVSSGTHSMYANSDVPTCGNCKNYYRDDRLIAAGGKANGTLDFYQVHYYPEHFDNDRNPFAHPASYWNLDKPIVIGEFPAGDWINQASWSKKYRHEMTNQAAFAYAFDNGYAGALSWDYNGFTDGIDPTRVQGYEQSKPSMLALYTAHESAIKIKDVVRAPSTGNGVMQITFTNVTSEASIERQKNFVFTGQTTLQVDVRVVSGSPFSFRAVLKTGSGWDWRQNETICDVPVGNGWTTCTFNLAEFTEYNNPTNKADLANVKSILFQTFTAAYSGVVQFDNVRAGAVVVDNFDVKFDVWSKAGGMPGGDAISSIETVFVQDGSTPIVPNKMQTKRTGWIGKMWDLLGRAE